MVLKSEIKRLNLANQIQVSFLDIERACLTNCKRDSI